MSFLVDTNIISEVCKGPRCDPNVVADESGRMNAIRPMPVIDGLLAATAEAHRMTFVTRNDTDVEGVGARVLNPFTA